MTARHLRTTLLPPSESLCPLPSQASLVESRRVLVWKILRVQGKGPPPAPWLEQGVPCSEPVHNVHFVKYDVTVSFMAQVLDTVAYFVSHVLVVDTVTYFDIFR